MRRAAPPVVGCALAALCASLLLAGPAASGPDASPVARVDWRLTAVGRERPPNIVETRIAGKGTLAFESSPYAAEYNPASSASGTIVVEYDILNAPTGTARTARLTLKVTGAKYEPSGVTGSGAFKVTTTSDTLELEVVVSRSEDGEGKQIDQCRVGARGVLIVSHNKKNAGYALDLRENCGIKHGQQALIGASSRVQVTISPKCLRTPSARRPLCGKAAPAGTFKLAKTEVKNADPARLTINAAAGTARSECCPGSMVAKTAYTFKVPKTLVAGKKAQVSIGLTIESVEPRQPLSVTIGVIAPDFRRDLEAQYLEQPSRSATYTFPISAGYATAKELTIHIGFPGGSEVIYHYRK